jgi:hypothetical protein
MSRLSYVKSLFSSWLGAPNQFLKGPDLPIEIEERVYLQRRFFDRKVPAISTLYTGKQNRGASQENFNKKLPQAGLLFSRDFLLAPKIQNSD